jgi:predicted enzyme related to lactoylglutathione lyase
VAKAQELGGSVLMGPADIEPGRFAVVADNLGAVFSILRLKS